jgi:hypothetical protein
VLLDVRVPRADVYVRVGFSSKFTHNDGYERTVERTVVGHIIYEQDAHRAAVVRRGYSAEALLTGGIPLWWEQTNTLSWIQENRTKRCARFVALFVCRRVQWYES